MNPIYVRAKLIGRRGPVLAPLILNPEGPVGTLRELLVAIVQQQVAEFLRSRHEAQFLKVLTQDQVDSGRETGRIMPGGRPLDEPSPDVDQAAAAAMTAFQDGLYFVFVNDEQVEQLDHELPVVRDVLLVRLTPLVGG